MEGNPTARDAMPVPGKSMVGDRLHVCVGDACNNNCIFCMEEDREARRQRLSAQTDEDVRRMMSVPGVREVMFTSGEPTLHPRLVAYVAMARDLGFPIVGMITNGRRLSYRPYARSLLEAGLNHILISIHGPDARTHDALTRTKGAFVQALAGMANLVLLRREFPALKVHTSYVVNRRNYRLFREFYDVMLPFRVDQHVFNVMMPDGRGLKHFDALVARYSDIAESFGRFVAGLPPEGVRRVFLLDIPYCVTQGLPDSVRGYVERYFHYEPDAPGLFEGEVPGDAPVVKTGETTFEAGALDGEGKTYAKVSKSAHDEMVRAKRPECAACGYNAMCRGVFRSYLARHGWDEFVPVKKG